MECITRLLKKASWALLLSTFICTGALAESEVNDNAVILLYHHVATDTPASTSISPHQFAQHMAFIDKHYTVKALPEVIKALQNKESLPDKTLVITFDDGYADILHNAHPVLKKYGFPYTVFINPGTINKQSKQLTWEQVKRMKEDGVTFANHTMSHPHMLQKQSGESQDAWLKRVWQEVTEAEKILKQQIGESLKFLAYPFGEYNQALAQQLKKNGYVGFAQHSGGIASHSDFTALPRFPAAGPYAKLESLKTKMASLAMPVIESNISDPQLSERTLDDGVTFEVSSDDVDLNRVACFFQGEVIKHSVTDNTVSFKLKQQLPAGRSRANCTAPSKAHSGRYYWYSQPFFIADKNGNYPD